MKRILTALMAALALAFAGTALAQKAEAPKADAKKMETKADAKKPAAAPMADMKKEPMDINTASEKDLAMLKGIGDVRAKAIVKGRPYKGKDELVQKKIIPQGVYDGIKDQIIAKQDMAKTEMKKAEPMPPKKDEKKK
ncbi:MAG TPA: helix-hairpin-helix domain-containing protein [Usitatibacter sp.]|nr:helix-hairpin-helix domain-containing protein [Usitatibacter sp.]